VRAIEGLSVMRNLAGHSRGGEISPENATEYLVLAEATIYTIGQPRGS
jgi:hypothetical protein